ncbi:D-alanine--D-alanine ligase family protein [Boudabousia marimammalium]|uniref:D-alanine--D-alanine ligase n=1 Tax=Boudabousia marimammalium TaxID=156892 RepID=A0A1Q5PSL2_9ACTO|nr:D-alanine--D-alanine ligase [Boudabousia marimammalium]OKL50568.1 hypothetical protein BM477_00985 [Boudabousia marimammalium]
MSPEPVVTAKAESEGVTVAIIAGGVTYERDISIRSAHYVAKALRSVGFKTVTLNPDQTLIDELRKFKPALVWPLMHGGIGEDGSLQGLLEMLKIPFVGSSADSARMASSKPLAKSIVRNAGVATPDSVTMPRALFSQIGAHGLVDLMAQSMHFPLIVKPVDGGSSLGVSRVDSINELRSALVEAFAYSDSALIEKYIVGREITVSLVDTGDGLKALSPVEIDTDTGTYDFEARYSAGRSVFFAPARLTEAENVACVEAAEICGRSLRMRDIARIDLLLDAEGTPWFIDSNVSPGMTEMSLFPQAAKHDSTMPELLKAVVEAKLSEVE